MNIMADMLPSLVYTTVVSLTNSLVTSKVPNQIAAVF